MKLSLSTDYAVGSNIFVLVDNDSLQETQQRLEIQHLDSVIRQATFKADLNEGLQIFHANTMFHLLGVGALEKLNSKSLEKLAQTILSTSQKRYPQIQVDLSALPAHFHSTFAHKLTEAAYQYSEFKSEAEKMSLTQIQLIAKESPMSDEQLQFLNAVASGQTLTRDLGNCPPNICNPSYLAQMALDLAEQYPDVLKVQVLEQSQLEDLGMNAFLAVAKGSDQPPCLITIEYRADLAQDPIVLVGKGVTFDSGGISIKPSSAMDEMKYDMCGAATVFGVIRALCEAKLPVHVVGAIAAVENMPSGRATRPGDIVSTMSGQTVEILNTDAEGRLVLCDALTYIQRFQPDVVIDIATLTGACVVALGAVLSGLFSPDDALAEALINAGRESTDQVWRMPVTDDYQELLDSPFADIGNIGGTGGGAITAACFLQRFTKDYRWAHLDIAGTAWKSGVNKGATGRPVPLLMQYIQNTVRT